MAEAKRDEAMHYAEILKRYDQSLTGDSVDDTPVPSDATSGDEEDDHVCECDAATWTALMHNAHANALNAAISFAIHNDVSDVEAVAAIAKRFVEVIEKGE